MRKPAEYAGTDLQSRHGGHVPGAVNVDWELFVHPDNTFRSPAEIRAIVDTAVRTHGGTDATSLRAAYCQGGVRAAAAWFALSVGGRVHRELRPLWRSGTGRDGTPSFQPADVASLSGRARRPAGRSATHPGRLRAPSTEAARVHPRHP
jgi:hypothetical protein